MICWSCQKNAGSDVFCPHCRAIQPPDAAATFFDVLGVPRRFSIDVDAAEARYKELARAVHPDRFARADPQARRAAMKRTVQINEAWRKLRDPVQRAEYLLELGGIEVGGEEGTVKRVDGGGKTRVPVPQELLMDMLEQREALADARMEGDDARVASLAAVMRGRLDESMRNAATLLDDGGDLDRAADEVVNVRYLRRFLEEADAHLDRPGLATAGPRPEGA